MGEVVPTRKLSVSMSIIFDRQIYSPKIGNVTTRSRWESLASSVLDINQFYRDFLFAFKKYLQYLQTTHKTTNLACL